MRCVGVDEVWCVGGVVCGCGVVWCGVVLTQSSLNVHRMNNVKLLFAPKIAPTISTRPFPHLF